MLGMSTPEIRRERARIAALNRWANTPPSQRSRKARSSFRTRFENQVDPDRTLPPAERAVLVDAAIRAYTARMRLAQMKKRSGD